MPLVLVSAAYGMLRVQQEVRARVDEERERAAGMARTIQIAVENAFAVRGRHQMELVGLLDDLTRGQPAIQQIRVLDRDGQVLAASSSPTPPPAPRIDARNAEYHRRNARRRQVTFALLAAPALLWFLALMLWPLANMFYISTMRWDGLG